MSIFSPHSRCFGNNRLFKHVRPLGFTLIEMLVVSGIITIITLFLLLRQASFDSSTIMRSLAFSVALSVRQAQVYGTSVLGVSTGAGQAYAPGYGVSVGAAGATSYTIFADVNNNGRYDASGGEAVRVFSLSSGYTISEACVLETSGSSLCNGPDDQGTSPLSGVNIVFKRPNPDAVFVPISASGSPIPGSYVSAYLQLRSSNGLTRNVRVSATGQVSVESPQAQLGGSGSQSMIGSISANTPCNIAVGATTCTVTATYTGSNQNGALVEVFDNYGSVTTPIITRQATADSGNQSFNLSAGSYSVQLYGLNPSDPTAGSDGWKMLDSKEVTVSAAQSNPQSMTGSVSASPCIITTGATTCTLTATYSNGSNQQNTYVKIYQGTTLVQQQQTTPNSGSANFTLSAGTYKVQLYGYNPSDPTATAYNGWKMLNTINVTIQPAP